MDDKQDIVVTMQISLTDKGEAVTLAEFLQELLDMMHIEGVVSYTNENKRKKTNEEILLELGYYPNEIKKILDELDESDES